MKELFFFYIIVVNILGLALKGIDKKKAQNKGWRIKESTLFLVAAVGGSLGTYAGMELFRHKTKHAKFTLGLPAILLIHGVLIIGLGRRFPI